jgi:hypothetical protein
MRKLGEKLKRNLEARHELLDSMKTILVRQHELLQAGAISDCCARCGEVDDVIASLKERDYEIARLEMLSGDVDIIAYIEKDRELRNLVRKTAGVTLRNAGLVDELAVSLVKYRNLRGRRHRKTVPECNPGA